MQLQRTILRRFKKPERVDTNIVAGKKYTKTELAEIADQLLRDDARCEVCLECASAGEKTGNVRSEPQYNTEGDVTTDDNGKKLILDYAEFVCKTGHKWYQGEGKAKGIDGDAPILFEEHFRSRMRREIYTMAESAMGRPEPEIQSGMYWRTHPQGRKVNSKAARRASGAGWYKGLRCDVIEDFGVQWSSMYQRSSDPMRWLI